MSSRRLNSARAQIGARGPNARSTLAFAAIGDHERLPARFFARLFAADGRVIRSAARKPRPNPV
jgi:hypothetical protein